jgi:hypothetical protein
MPDIPSAAIAAAATAIERELMSGKDYTMAADSDEALARAALDAAAPILAEAVAQKITAHMNAHGPGAGSPGLTLHATLQRAWRRHFSIAARVAAEAFYTREDQLRLTAQAIERGDFIACEIPEIPEVPR